MRMMIDIAWHGRVTCDVDQPPHQNERHGRVFEFANHIVTGQLSKYTMKANSPPAATPEAICGNVTRQKVVSRLAPRKRAASSRVLIHELKAGNHCADHIGRRRPRAR